MLFEKEVNALLPFNRLTPRKELIHADNSSSRYCFSEFSAQITLQNSTRWEIWIFEIEAIENSDDTEKNWEQENKFQELLN